MQKYRLATVFLIAIMATAILTLTPPLTSLTSADPWSPHRGPPIVVEDMGLTAYPPLARLPYLNGSIAEWAPIKTLNEDPLGDTELWSKNGTTANMSLYLNPRTRCMWEGHGLVPIAVLDWCRDLEALYMWFDPGDTISIRVDVRNLFPGFGDGIPLNGTPLAALPQMNASKYAIYFSTNLSFPGFNPLTGMVPSIPPGRCADSYGGLFLNGSCAWEYGLFWSENYAYIANSTGSDIAVATWMGGNIHMAIDYANSAFEIQFPRSVIEPVIPLKVVSIAVVSYKPGIWGNGTQSPGAKGYTGVPGSGVEDNTVPHPFDPQAVIRGACPPLAGEEMFQPAANGPDHADIMAPAKVDGSHPLAVGWHIVYDQKLVDMSPGAKIEVVDALTGQQNITNVYAKDESFVVNITIIDAIEVVGVQIGLEWTPGILNCTSFTTLFDYPPYVAPPRTFMGRLAWWIGLDGNITSGYPGHVDACGWTWIAGTKPSGSGTIIQATFDVLTDNGFTWICPYQVLMMFFVLGKWEIIEIPIKNAWFQNRPPPPPPPGPGEVKIKSQTPPPHYPGEQITIDLCDSVPGSNGTHSVPIKNYSLSVWFSNDTHIPAFDYLGPSHLVNFTPPVPDTYTVEVDIHLDPNFDPNYTRDHPDWLVNAKNITKLVIPKPDKGIDCFTEIYRLCGWTTTVLGKGWNQSADAYGLDEEVTVYSYVFYNGWPKQNFLVSYEVYSPNGTLVLIRTAMTNEVGIANISFRIMTVCKEYAKMAFGKWRIFQKVYMCEEPYNDTLWFDVGWLWELLTVTPDAPYFEYPAHMSFTIRFKSISAIARTVVLSVVVYDNDGVPIAVRTLKTSAISASYCNPVEDEITVDCLWIPKWFYPGMGKVYVNAWFNDIPTKCGHPACPEIWADVYLKAPPFTPDP